MGVQLPEQVIFTGQYSEMMASNYQTRCNLLNACTGQINVENSLIKLHAEQQFGNSKAQSIKIGTFTLNITFLL